MASISLLYVDILFSRSFSFRLSNAIGLSSCIKTIPTPIPDASHSTINGLLKSRLASTGVYVTASLSLLNASSATSFHLKASFFVKSISGDAIERG